MSDALITLDNITLSHNGKNVLDDVSFKLHQGEFVTLIGPNGAGKTTLLRIINGELSLDSGEIDIRPGVQIGYFHQDHRLLNFDLTPIEQIQFLKPKMEYANLRSMLGQFQFTSDMAKTKLSKLSGGERARVALLCLLLEENNIYLPVRAKKDELIKELQNI